MRLRPRLCSNPRSEAQAPPPRSTIPVRRRLCGTRDRATMSEMGADQALTLRTDPPFRGAPHHDLVARPGGPVFRTTKQPASSSRRPPEMPRRKTPVAPGCGASRKPCSRSCLPQLAEMGEGRGARPRPAGQRDVADHGKAADDIGEHRGSNLPRPTGKADGHFPNSINREARCNEERPSRCRQVAEPLLALTAAEPVAVPRRRPPAGAARHAVSRWTRRAAPLTAM